MEALITKECFKCGEVKSLSDFYKHPQMDDGHVNKCKECNKKDVFKNRVDNLEYIQEYDRNRRKKCNVSTERWEEISTKRKIYSKAYYTENPDKWEERLRKARKESYFVDEWEEISQENRDKLEAYYTENPEKWEERLAKGRKENCSQEKWNRVLEAKRKWGLENPEVKAQITKKYRENNPKKYKAHSAVGYAIKSGKLTPQPCEVCGNKEVHGHHCDYDKPLDVLWLCAEHHSAWHKENGEGLNAVQFSIALASS